MSPLRVEACDSAGVPSDRSVLLLVSRRRKSSDLLLRLRIMCGAKLNFTSVLSFKK
ncbi:uncharacterized, partial [Tachysurus ichikawai]